MGTGKTDNYKFYEGYEDEPEVEISADNMETLHIWDGFIMDIFCEPTLDGKGWHGFTRDYNQFEGAFDDSCGETVITNLQEYIDEETKEVYDLICSWFDKAQKNNCKEVKVTVF